MSEIPSQSPHNADRPYTLAINGSFILASIAATAILSTHSATPKETAALHNCIQQQPVETRADSATHDGCIGKTYSFESQAHELGKNIAGLALLTAGSAWIIGAVSLRRNGRADEA